VLRFRRTHELSSAVQIHLDDKLAKPGRAHCVDADAGKTGHVASGDFPNVTR